jgi:hypothetical protein
MSQQETFDGTSYEPRSDHSTDQRFQRLVGIGQTLSQNADDELVKSASCSREH